MKLITHAIGSIIDVNTGYGLTHHHSRSENPDLIQNSTTAHEIRSKPVINLIRKSSGFISDSIAPLKASANAKRTGNEEALELEKCG